MKPRRNVVRTIELRSAGFSIRAVAKDVGISRSTVRKWLSDPERALAREERNGPCGGSCSSWRDLDPENYAYLLGMYLGDGCISTQVKSVRIRIACDERYVEIIQEVAESIRRVSGRRVQILQRIGCVEVGGYWKHWPCIFPQHGRGPKHTRPIALEQWQKNIVQAHPRRFLRGLLHSDGCRAMNRVHRPVKGGRRTYVYPRYHFSNRSEDIKAIFCWACEILGLRWKRANAKEITINRREDVALLDSFVGPKK